MKDFIFDLIQCPTSDESLQKAEDTDELYTKNTSYPVFHDVPWLFPNPEESFIEWGSKVRNFIQVESSLINEVGNTLKFEKRPSTLARVQSIIDGKSHNLKYLESLLNIFDEIIPIPLAESTQNIYSYFELVFRDWHKESAEIECYTKLINEVISNNNFKNILILGSGAGRLSYNLALNNPKSQFISFDHNPLLSFLFKRILDGESINLSQVEMYAKNQDSYATVIELFKPSKELDNHQIVMGSFPDLPFKENSFDLIIAPWFLDIIESNLESSLVIIQKFLSKNGGTVYLGPNNFHKSEIFEQYGVDEIKSIYNDFFSTLNSESLEINYLKNDNSSQTRIEKILFLFAKSKITNIKTLKAPSSDKIKFDSKLISYKEKIKVFHRVLSQIDSDMTLELLASKLETEFSFSKEESLHYAGILYKQILKEIT